MRYLFISMLLFLGLQACSQNTKQAERSFPATITLSGKVNNPQAGVITLQVLEDNDLRVIDTIVLNASNEFSTQIVLNEPNFYRLNLYDMQMVNLVLSNEDVKVEVDGDRPDGLARVTGSSDTDLLTGMESIMLSFQEEANGLNDAFIIANTQNDSEEMNRLRESYMDMESHKNEKLKDLIRESRPSIAVLFGINTMNPDDHFPFFDTLATRLMEAYPMSSFVNDFNQFIGEMRNLAVGAMAPEIELPNPDGELTKLSSLRGQYVLIDFWAGWCRPCREENPNVVRLFNKYNPKGFTVFGVSLDRTRDEWINAIEADGLTWTQVSDVKYFNSEAAATYNIQAIPATVLVDPNGVIIAKNLRGSSLEAKLVELFGE
jgi:peroxiredoxin